MTPTPRQRTGLASAWSETHRRVVGGETPGAARPGRQGRGHRSESGAGRGQPPELEVPERAVAGRRPQEAPAAQRREGRQPAGHGGRSVARLRPAAEGELTDAAVERPDADAGRHDGDPDRRNRRRPDVGSPRPRPPNAARGDPSPRHRPRRRRRSTPRTPPASRPPRRRRPGTPRTPSRRTLASSTPSRRDLRRRREPRPGA